MEAVFMDDSDSECDVINPDSEAEMLLSEEEVEEDPGQSTSAAASSKASAKKHSKRRVLRKAEKKKAFATKNPWYKHDTSLARNKL